MRELKYGYFGEDEAQRIFLENYLVQLINNLGKSTEICFKFDKEFSYVYKGLKNSTIIDKGFAEAVRIGFIKYNHEVFFIGRDLDSHAEKDFKNKITSIINDIDEKFRDKTFLMIPVQCIEHWLLYLKIKTEKPKSTKNISLESKPNTEVKIELYGKARASNKISIPIVEEISKNIDFEYLENVSISFNTFNSHVKKFINNLS